MASKPKGKMNLSFPEEKMQALEFCLKEKGKNLDELLAEFLDGLYRKNVPVIMRKYLEPDKKEDQNESRESEASSESELTSGEVKQLF